MFSKPFSFFAPISKCVWSHTSTMINQPKPVITQYVKGFAYYSADQPTMDDFSCNH